MFPDDLPDDVLLSVFQALDPATLATVQTACHRFRKLASSDSVWKRKFVECFDDAGRTQQPGLRWMNAYRSRCRLNEPGAPIESRLEVVSGMLDANEGKNLTFLTKRGVVKDLALEVGVWGDVDWCNKDGLSDVLTTVLSKYSDEVGGERIAEEFQPCKPDYYFLGLPDNQYVNACGFLHDVAVGSRPHHEPNLPEMLRRDPVALSGAWEGFYVYGGSNHFDRMTLELKFDGEGGVAGRGEDICGPFTWQSEGPVRLGQPVTVQKDYDTWGWSYVGALGVHSLFGYWGGRGGYFKIWKLKELEAQR